MRLLSTLDAHTAAQAHGEAWRERTPEVHEERRGVHARGATDQLGVMSID